MKCEDFQFECSSLLNAELYICNHYNLGDPQSGGNLKTGVNKLNLMGKDKSFSAHVTAYQNNDGSYEIKVSNADVTRNHHK